MTTYKIRLNEEMKAGWGAAAKIAGLSLAEWIRRRCDVTPIRSITYASPSFGDLLHSAREGGHLMVLEDSGHLVCQICGIHIWDVMGSRCAPRGLSYQDRVEMGDVDAI